MHVLFSLCMVKFFFNLDGEERVHRNHDHAFKTEAEAQAWIEEQDDK